MTLWMNRMVSGLLKRCECSGVSMMMRQMVAIVLRQSVVFSRGISLFYQQGICAQYRHQRINTYLRDKLGGDFAERSQHGGGVGVEEGHAVGILI